MSYDEVHDNAGLFNYREDSQDNTEVSVSEENAVEPNEIGVFETKTDNTSDEAERFITAAFKAAEVKAREGATNSQELRKTISVPFKIWKKLKFAEISGKREGVTAVAVVRDAVAAAVREAELPEGNTIKNSNELEKLSVSGPQWWWASLEVLAGSIGNGATPADIIIHSLTKNWPKGV